MRNLAYYVKLTAYYAAQPSLFWSAVVTFTLYEDVDVSTFSCA